MANFAPNGYVELISGIKWHGDYADVRLFSSEIEQINWFNLQTKIAFDNCSYTRESQQFVAVNENIENLWQYNYMRYQNETMGNKWFYAFIDRLEYRAPMTTFVYFTIDVFQTWMFDYTFLESLIDRETVAATAGTKFYAPEIIDYGTEYETVSTAFVDGVGLDSTAGGSYVLIASTIDLGQDFGTYNQPNVVASSGVRINNLPYGCNFYKVNFSGISDFFNGFKDYPWISNGIIGMTIIPDYMLATVPVETISMGGSGSGLLIQQLLSGNNTIASSGVWTGNIFDNFEAVTHPKLLMWPYSFIEISAQNGYSIIVKPQYLNGSNLTVFRRSVVGMNPEIKYYLDGYQGDGEMYDYAISIKDFPQLPLLNVNYMLSSFQTDRLVTQGQLNNLGGYFLNSIGSLFSGNLISSLANIAGGVMSTQMSIDQAEAIRDRANAQSPTLQTQAGGTSFNYATGQLGLTIRWKMIPEGYRNIVGEYFTKCGVKSNRLKVPNINQMSRFDYLKTIDCKIDAHMPHDDESIIINACNAGVTFWHDDNIGIYDNNQGA